MITWIPTPTPSLLNINEAGVPDEWLSVAKPDAVNTSIISTHTNGISCVVTYNIAPSLPTGLNITVLPTGISLYGDSKNVLSKSLNVEYSIPTGVVSSIEIPENSILSKYTPNPIFKESFILTLTANWTWQDGASPTTTEYIQPFKISFYNRWISDKEDILYILKR